MAASYPFPTRNPAFPQDHNIIFPSKAQVKSAEYVAAYGRSLSEEARTNRLRYINIEEELERAYRYVSPADANGKTFSLKFAEIIRSAANAYELMSRVLYLRFYNDTDEINIFNYLALDRFLGLASAKVEHLMAVDSFPNYPETQQPFIRLANWDQNSPVIDQHIPAWWTANNKLKHTDEGLQLHGTLANATAAVAGLMLLIERVYGCGILRGGGVSVPDPRPNSHKIGVLTKWARLFAPDS
jgi:hypothetical protein